MTKDRIEISAGKVFAFFLRAESPFGSGPGIQIGRDHGSLGWER